MKQHAFAFLLPILTGACWMQLSPDEDLQATTENSLDARPGGEAFTAEMSREYMRQIVPWFVARELDPTEITALETQKYAAIPPMLENWTKEPAFPRALRRIIAQKLSVSGTRDGIDFELPGNLAEYVVKQNLPVTTLLTADYCVDASGAKKDCDSGAPFKAGVLGTRAYLASRSSRFNLTRASTMLKAFACEEYPMDLRLQPRIERSRLIPMFQRETATDDNGNVDDQFGNGAACFLCHSQFSLHAQVFVRFDETGMWRANATGKQDEKGELGRSTNGLFASHLVDPTEAQDEKSQVFGKQVANLAQAARVIAESQAFLPCQTNNLVQYALRLPADAHVKPDVVANIVQRASAGGSPTFATLVVETFSHPSIIASVIRGLATTR